MPMRAQCFPRRQGGGGAAATAVVVAVCRSDRVPCPLLLPSLSPLWARQTFGRTSDDSHIANTLRPFGMHRPEALVSMRLRGLAGIINRLERQMVVAQKSSADVNGGPNRMRPTALVCAGVMDALMIVERIITIPGARAVGVSMVSTIVTQLLSWLTQMTSANTVAKATIGSLTSIAGLMCDLTLVCIAVQRLHSRLVNVAFATKSGSESPRWRGGGGGGGGGGGIAESIESTLELLESASASLNEASAGCLERFHELVEIVRPSIHAVKSARRTPPTAALTRAHRSFGFAWLCGRFLGQFAQTCSRRMRSIPRPLHRRLRPRTSARLRARYVRMCWARSRRFSST